VYADRVSAKAIDEFWGWWTTARSGFAAAFSGGPPLSDEAIAAMSEHVAAIDEALDWEFGAGVTSQHHLCLSGKGDPVTRVVAERWVKRGPPADATFEYYAARQPNRDAESASLSIDGATAALGELVFSVEEDTSSERIHVHGHHPVFATLEDDELCARILFLGLDGLLGEDGVERWIGGVEVSREAIADAVPYLGLRARVDDLARRATGFKGAVLKGERDGRPIFVTVNRALKRVDHLLLDMHVAIDVELLAPTDAGLTTNEEAATLNAMEDELFAALGAHAVSIGRETCDARRTLHLHVTEGGPARAIVDRWAARHAPRRIMVETRMDPRWDVLHRWG
jgi:hypothetical protein